jgi:hypothetical protein
MRSFSDVTETIRETSTVMLISLTFVFLLIAAVIIPSVMNRGNLLNPIFILGLIIFGVTGFMAFEIISMFGFLGGGVKYGVAGFIILLLVGAATGGRYIVAFLLGSISGAALFYLKSIYAIYYIVRTETRKTEDALSISEMESQGEINHFVVDGVGSNFELINNMVEELSEGKEILYYARYSPVNETRWSRLTEETIRFYANHLAPLQKIKSRRSSKVIKQIAFKATYMDTLENGLFNYWLRGYLAGRYTSVIVPFGDDFVEKAAVCERSYGEELEIEEVLGDSAYLILLKSLTPEEEGSMDIYTRWTHDELLDGVSKVHPVN